MTVVDTVTGTVKVTDTAAMTGDGNVMTTVVIAGDMTPTHLTIAVDDAATADRPLPRRGQSIMGQ